MIERIKQNWHEFKESQPGHRFQDRYDRRQEKEHGRWSAGKIVNLVLGLAIIAAGIFLVAAPGPGWIVVFIGFGFIASEFAPVARGMDWAELKARAIADWAKEFWDRASLVVKALLVLFALAIAGALAYGAYYLFFGGSS